MDVRLFCLLVPTFGYLLPESRNNLTGAFGGLRRNYSSLVRRKRIISGEKVMFEEAKFVASLQRKVDRSPLCGGTLITFTIILTSCKCVQFGLPTKAGFPHNKPSEYIVVAGDRYYTNKLDELTREVLRFQEGDKCKYNAASNLWQFASGYVEVVKPFDKGSINIVERFPPTQMEYETGFSKYFSDVKFAQGGNEYCFVFGWGLLQYQEDKSSFVFPEYIMKRAVQFITREECQRKLCAANLCDFKLEESGAVCLTPPGPDDPGPLCDGDQGSPLLCYNRIWAVGELTPLCGTELKFSIFYKLDIAQILAFQNAATSQLTFPSFLWMMILPLCLGN